MQPEKQKYKNTITLSKSYFMTRFSSCLRVWTDSGPDWLDVGCTRKLKKKRRWWWGRKVRGSMQKQGSRRVLCKMKYDSHWCKWEWELRNPRWSVASERDETVGKLTLLKRTVRNIGTLKWESENSKCFDEAQKYFLLMLCSTKWPTAPKFALEVMIKRLCCHRVSDWATESRRLRLFFEYSPATGCQPGRHSVSTRCIPVCTAAADWVWLHSRQTVCLS
jgi:hypothetical protein